MFLHLGGNTVVALADVVAIFDIESTTISRETREFLRVQEEEGFVTSVSDDIPKAFVVTENSKGIKVYLTSISSATLHKRSSFLKNISNI